LRPVGQGSRTSRQRFYEPPRDATSRSTFKNKFSKRIILGLLMAAVVAACFLLLGIYIVGAGV
jgi:hypothetical protein